MLKYWPLALILLGAISLLLFNQGERVKVAADQTLKQTVYSIVGRDRKELSLTVYQSELNNQVMSLRSASTLSLNEQMKLVSRLLTKVSKDRSLNSFKTLSLGRLVMAFGSDRTFSDRLVSAARSAAPFDARGINNLTRDLANDRLIYTELKEVFAKFGLKIKVSAVEKVLINKDRLPYDCQVWFSIIP